jgi:hypothetical protein
MLIRDYYRPSMERTDSRQFDISKLVFLAILLAAVFAAWTVSTRRTTLEMQPVDPVCDEMGISMPSGGGWQSIGAEGWTYQQSTFFLKRVYGDEQTCTAEVRYHLSPITGDVTAYLAAVSGPRGLERIAQGEIEAGGVNWVWASYATAEGQPQYHYAVAPLGQDRMVTVFVWGRAGAWLLAESAFNSIIKSAKYQDTGLLQKGAELVAAAREQGLSSIQTLFPSDAFLVKDSAGEAAGFQMIRTVVTAQPQEAVMEAMYYQADSGTSSSRTRFVTPDLDNFVWHTWNPSNPGFSAIVKVEESVLLAAVRGGSRRNELNLSRAAIADAVVELAGWQLVKQGLAEAVVDAVSYDGAVTPMRIAPGGPPADGDAWKYSVVFTSMVDPQVRSEVRFDEKGAVQSRIEHRRQTLVFERATNQRILTLFPQLEGEISQFLKGTSGSETPVEEVDYDRRPI